MNIPIYIYIYIYICNSLNTLSGGKSCLVAPRVAIAPWATETVITPVLRLMRTGYRTCFHTLYNEYYYIYYSIYIYIYGYIYCRWLYIYMYIYVYYFSIFASVYFRFHVGLSNQLYCFLIFRHWFTRIWIHTRMNTYTLTQTNTNIHAHIHIRENKHTRARANERTDIYLLMYWLLSTNVYIYLYDCKYIDICVYMCI